jgi:multiple sugar transport system substrate-binding protein
VALPPSRRSFLRNVAGAVGAAGAGAVALGCDDRRAATRPGRVTIDFYTYSTPADLVLYEKQLHPAFTKAHPYIDLRFNLSLGDAGYDAKLLTLIAGKIAPDVFHVTQQNFPFYAAKDILLPLDDFLRNDPEVSLDDFYPRVVDGMRYKGQLVGLPTDFSTIVTFYNQTLVERAKLAPPADDWTWDDYLSMCRALTRRPEVFGTSNPSAYNRWPAWVWMNGGDIFTPDVSRCTMDTPEAIEGLKFYVDLSLKHNVAPTLSQSLGQNFQDLFASGLVAVIADSRFSYKRFNRGKGLPFKWDVAPVPRGKSQATTFIWGGNCILKSTKHPREAWELVKYLSGPPGAAINIAAGNALPAHRPSAERAVREPTDPKTPKRDVAFLDAIAYGRQAPFPAQYAEFNAAMSELNDAFLGIIPVDEACRRFTNEVNGVLAGGVF